MGREKIGPATLVRLPEEVLARIDALAGDGKRAAWIRDVIEAALDPGKIPTKPAGGEPVQTKGPMPSEAPRPTFRNLGTAEEVREAVRDKPKAFGVTPRRPLTREEKLAQIEGHPLLKRVYWAVREHTGSAREIAARTGMDVASVSRAELRLSAMGAVRYGVEGRMEACIAE